MNRYFDSQRKMRVCFTILISQTPFMIGGYTAEKKPRIDKSSTETIQQTTSKMLVYIILGSTRQGRLSEAIAHAVKEITDSRPEISVEIIDLRDYLLPFLDEQVTPDSRVEFTNPIVKRWSEKITAADGFILVVPEYNVGYPGVLKNALDILYKEWNNKPVAFIGYSGGPSGGASAVAQLQQVVSALAMIPISPYILLPRVSTIFGSTEKKVFPFKNQNAKINTLIDQLLKNYAKNK